MHEQPTSGRPARRYRCYYARYSPHVGQGSRTVVELYDRGVRWPQNPTMPFEIAVDLPSDPGRGDRLELIEWPLDRIQVADHDSPEIGVLLTEDRDLLQCHSTPARMRRG